VLYTNSGGDKRGDWLAEKSKSAGFNVQVMNMGGGDLINRLIAEKNNPVADIVFGANAVDFGKLVKAGVLYKFEPAWLNKIDPALADPNGLFYAMGVSPLVMFYNTKVYTSATIAKDWVDLATNPAYKDKYCLLGLGGGTARMIISSILIEHADPKGLYGVSDKGWDVMRQFIQNGHLEQSGEDWFGAVAAGDEYSIGELWLAGLLMRKKERDAPHLDFVVPPKGIPYVWESIGIIKTGKNETRAKQWVDWFGSTETQNEWSALFGHIPTNKETYSSFTKELNDAMARIHPQNIDWSLATENLDKWMEKIQLEFVK
jgi:iron(III) transport system substrate-binding protein